jgi:hypothetical protein
MVGKFANDAIKSVLWKNRSYWIARYHLRNDVYEWDVDWSLLPRVGLKELILRAPNGKSGVLGHSSNDISDRAFQFKIAIAGAERELLAQVIGVVLNPDYDCVCYAVEGVNLIGPFEDNISPGRFQYGGGAMALPNYDVLGIGI